MYQILLGLSLLLTSGCRSAELDAGKSQVKAEAAVHGFLVGEPWDIYQGGQYRYGPSIIRNADNSIDAWFAAPGGTFGERILHYQDTRTESPVSLKEKTTAAQKFRANTPFYAIAVVCPNWHSPNSSITFSLYAWKTDYASTLKGKPLATKRFENFQDNQHLFLTKQEKFGPGEYLWVLNQPTGTAGVWRREAGVPAVINYLDGKETSGSFFSYQLLEKSSGGIFWDQCAYRRSTDGGKTWTPDEMVLLPTEGSRDEFSICDPGVVKFGGYYYLGYTSTEDKRQIFNHVYVARSQSPEGPWLKWDGTGWSDKPQPVVVFTGHPDAWGAGEPSLVVNNDTLFFYYTWHDKTVLETRVATASIRDSDWPARLTYQGVAIDKTSIAGADHCDVKFRDDIKRYQAIHAASRFKQDSHIVLWESADGLRFRKKTEIRANLKPFLHNCGWSGDEKGHIDPAKPQYISYAYGTDWGNWKTAWSLITFD